MKTLQTKLILIGLKNLCFEYTFVLVILKYTPFFGCIIGGTIITLSVYLSQFYGKYTGNIFSNTMRWSVNFVADGAF